MQNLIDDPVFYNLLVNNRESTISKSSSISSNEEIPQEKQSQQVVVEEPLIKNELDFSFLSKVEFPMNGGTSSTSYAQSEQSYQNSIFSENVSLESSIDGFDIPGIDDFFNKDMPMQISNELSSLNKQPSQPLQSLQPSKQFHKFYSSTTPISSTTTASPIAKQSLTYHKCPFCQRQFKNKSYLSRHLKKHDTVKDFKCPFFNEQHTKCHHLNGEFSRKDTFKAHLKSIHFIYPIGVAKCDRNLSIGRCAGCFQEFKNNNEWLNEHIEKNACSAIAARRGL